MHQAESKALPEAHQASHRSGPTPPGGTDRVQSVERVVNATDEEAAIAKVEAELQKPYGLLGSWKTVDTQIEVAGALEDGL
jgi:hypothetical protein